MYGREEGENFGSLPYFVQQDDDFVRMQIVREADKTLSQINKAANKAEGKERKELRKLYNEQVSEVVRLLDEVGKE